MLSARNTASYVSLLMQKKATASWRSTAAQTFDTCTDARGGLRTSTRRTVLLFDEASWAAVRRRRHSPPSSEEEGTPFFRPPITTPARNGFPSARTSRTSN